MTDPQPSRSVALPFSATTSRAVATPAAAIAAGHDSIWRKASTAGDTSRVERRLIPGHSPMEPVVGFSRAVVSGQNVHVAGTAPIPKDGEPPDDAYDQMRLCLEIVGGALEQAGAGFEDVVRTRMFIVRHRRLAGDRARPRRGLRRHPARRRRRSSSKGLLDPRWRVEIEAEAVFRELVKQIYPNSITGKGAVQGGERARAHVRGVGPVHARRRGGVHAPGRRDVRPRPAHRHRAAGDLRPRARAADQRRADAVRARDRDPGLPERRRRPARAAEAARAT